MWTYVKRRKNPCEENRKKKRMIHAKRIEEEEGDNIYHPLTQTQYISLK
jgi:hypothetical protein